eukprot:gene16710-19058_t
MSTKNVKRKADRLVSCESDKTVFQIRKVPKISQNEAITTTVCNVKVKYLRPEYKDLKDWTNGSDNVYIGRAGVVFVNGERFPKKQSIWANPFKVGRDGTLAVILKKYQQYILEKIKMEPSIYNVEELRGRNLGCWCVPAASTLDAEPTVCHGQILLCLLSNKDV